MTTTVVAGNPKPGSRTLDAATSLATALTGSAPDHVVDVVTLGAGLLGWGDDAVKAAVETVASSDLVIVASPTFKATYTGILKLFLDQFATGDGLRDVTAVPLMLGATCPAPGLYLLDSTYTTDTRIADYAERCSAAIGSTVRTEA